jgi:predicted metal-dependent hydrolase
MPAQLANESFRADHVRFGNSVGAVVQVLMRSYIPAAERFFRDHLRAYRSEISAANRGRLEKNIESVKFGYRTGVL